MVKYLCLFLGERDAQGFRQQRDIGKGGDIAIVPDECTVCLDIWLAAPIFVGPLKDNTGKTVIEGTLGLYDPQLWGTDYLLEGIVGSIT